MINDDWDGEADYATVQRLTADHIARAALLLESGIRESLLHRAESCGDENRAYVLARRALSVDCIINDARIHARVKLLPERVVQGSHLHSVDALFFEHNPMPRRYRGRNIE